MPKCIFCEVDVPHQICKRPERPSLCLDCLVEMKRFEVQNNKEITNRLFPEDYVEALERLKKMDTSKQVDPVEQAQMQKDLQLVMQYFQM